MAETRLLALFFAVHVTGGLSLFAYMNVGWPWKGLVLLVTVAVVAGAAWLARRT